MFSKKPTSKDSLETPQMDTGPTENSQPQPEKSGDLDMTPFQIGAALHTGTLEVNFSVSSSGDLTMISHAISIPKGLDEAKVFLEVGKACIAQGMKLHLLKDLQTASGSTSADTFPSPSTAPQYPTPKFDFLEDSGSDE